MAGKKNNVAIADLPLDKRNKLLLQAAYDGDLDKLRAVLAAGVGDVDIQTAGGYTALMSFALRGETEGMELLIAAGASVNAVEGANGAPLMRASSVEAAQVLLKAGAEVNFQSYNGWTALMAMAKRGNPEGVALLLQSGANPNVVTEHGRTALIHAADDAKGPGARRCLELLVQAGADVNARTSLGWTALRSAVKAKHAGCVEYLLSVDADVNVASSHGLTALSAAEDMTIARMLLQHAGDPNVADSDKQRTSLMRVAFDGNLEMVNLLLDHGANPDLPDSEGQTALLAAAAFRDLDGGYHAIGMDQRLPVIDLLIQRGANINATDRRGWSALMLAAQAGHAKTVERLLEAGANPLLATVRGRNAFLVAATPEIARCILDSMGRTPEGEALICAGAQEVADRFLATEVKRAVSAQWRENRREPTDKQKLDLQDKITRRLCNAAVSPDYCVILAYAGDATEDPVPLTSKSKKSKSLKL